MKAITCSQCGALIKRIRIRDKFAECEYCHATIPILKEKVIVIPDKKIHQPPQRRQLRKLSEKEQATVFKSFEDDSNPFFVEEDLNIIKTIGVMALVALMIGIPIILSMVLVSRSETPDTKINPLTGQDSSGESTDTTFELPTPIPSIRYRVNVTYNSLYGAEHIEIPTIEHEKLPTFDIAELKKTVFKQKRIKVRMTVNKEGEVTSAKALNGHEVLRESAEKAAKRSLFSTRRRESKITLTYIYLLEE